MWELRRSIGPSRIQFLDPSFKRSHHHSRSAPQALLVEFPDRTLQGRAEIRFPGS